MIVLGSEFGRWDDYTDRAFHAGVLDGLLGVAGITIHSYELDYSGSFPTFSLLAPVSCMRKIRGPRQILKRSRKHMHSSACQYMEALSTGHHRSTMTFPVAIVRAPDEVCTQLLQQLNVFKQLPMTK